MKRYKLIAVLLAGASVLGFAENAARVVHYHANDIVAIAVPAARQQQQQQ